MKKGNELGKLYIVNSHSGLKIPLRKSARILFPSSQSKQNIMSSRSILDGIFNSSE